MNQQEKLQLRAMSVDFAVRFGATEQLVEQAGAIYSYLTQDVPQPDKAEKTADVIRASGTIRPFEVVSKD